MLPSIQRRRGTVWPQSPSTIRTRATKNGYINSVPDPLECLEYHKHSFLFLYQRVSSIFYRVFLYLTKSFIRSDRPSVHAIKPAVPLSYISHIWINPFSRCVLYTTSSTTAVVSTRLPSRCTVQLEAHQLAKACGKRPVSNQATNALTMDKISKIV